MNVARSAKWLLCCTLGCGAATMLLRATPATAAETSSEEEVLKRRQGFPDDKKPRELTFDSIKFEMVRNAEFRRSLVTEEIEKLDGKRIKIRGFMLPSFQQEGITQFVLVRDNLECCFGPGAMLFDCLIVDMNEGKSATYSIRPVTVEGIFTIEELADEDGMTLAIYHLQAVQVK
ncbi:MAG: DUF3299 domain-containing protein [Planctomycetia bacterium]|nr:DUF3299 domain-containing protein [Planctomycetia bacterium]